jgi:acyl-CoA synthetase (AMP-forming)/AMP-acid ligase II
MQLVLANIEATYNLDPADRGLLVMPLFHVNGLMAGLLTPLLSGGSAIIPSQFPGNNNPHSQALRVEPDPRGQQGISNLEK